MSGRMDGRARAALGASSRGTTRGSLHACVVCRGSLQARLASPAGPGCHVRILEEAEQRGHGVTECGHGMAWHGLALRGPAKARTAVMRRGRSRRAPQQVAMHAGGRGSVLSIYLRSGRASHTPCRPSCTRGLYCTVPYCIYGRMLSEACRPAYRTYRTQRVLYRYEYQHRTSTSAGLTALGATRAGRGRGAQDLPWRLMCATGIEPQAASCPRGCAAAGS